ncbi:endonuclease/exonuclease/phosphatase family protein [Paenibacillus senegalensis]|uniref:endonuclease/exonuclease/phosphatase family protein n=1 Tax=Paenibacillus senegalensis TaxID=1465766 RepID=UPI000287FBBA|nr:endonuclease/exonuclease/phosphatase family protein [Paenibacillus senegalensis]
MNQEWGASNAADGTKELTVMSFNILHGEGMIDGKLDLERIASIIEASGAELIGLQEVDKHFSARSHYVDQGVWLAERLGMDYAYGANLTLPAEDDGKPERQYGTLVLSRFPIIYKKNHKLVQLLDVNRPEARGLLETHIDIQGSKVIFFNTHLGLDSRERMQQAEQIMDKAKGRTEPIIMSGDFNAAPDSPEIIRLTSMFRDSLAGTEWEKEFTLVQPNADKTEYVPVKRIDYLFSSKELRVKDARILNEAIISDHYPLAATYSIDK